MLRCIVQTNDKVLTFEHCTNYKISDRVFARLEMSFGHHHPSTLVGKNSGEIELHLGAVLLLDHFQEDGVDGDVAVDADGEGA